MGMQTPPARRPARNASTALQTASPDPRWPEIPNEVRCLIRRGIVSTHLVFPDNAPSREVVVWRAPAVSDPALLACLEEHLVAVEACLEPMGRGELLARILALLSHYRVEPQPPQVEMMMADDWAEDLGHYPAWAVEAAAKQWRQTRKFKPQISEMMALCESECREKRIHRDRLRAMVDAAHREASPLARQISALAGTLLGRIPQENWD